MSRTPAKPERTTRSGPFTRDELRLPFVDRWTPLRILFYPITAVVFWAWLLPGALIAYTVNRLYSLVTSHTATPATATVVAPLDPTDAVWLHDTPTNHNIITAILTLSSPPLPYTALLTLVSDRLLHSAGMQRLQCTIDLASRRWLHDPHFQLREHVTCWRHWRAGSTALSPPETELSDNGAAADGDEWSEEGCSRALQRLLASVVNTPIQSRSGRPSLWSFTLLPGYGAGSVIVFRAHHVLADGVLLSGVLLEMMMDPSGAQPATTAAPIPHSVAAERPLSPSATSTQPLLQSHSDAAASSSSAPATLTSPASPSPSSTVQRPTLSSPPKPPSLRARATHRLRFISALLSSMLLGPLHLLALSFHSDDFNALHHAHSLSVHKSVHWSTHPVSVARVKRIGRYYGASVNDVMMSVMLAAIDRATTATTQHSGTRQTGMHFLVPINVRPLLSSLHSSSSEQHRLGNLFAVLILRFPIKAESPRARLLAMTRQMSGVKRSALPLMMFVSLWLTTALLPSGWSGWLLDQYNDMCSGILTNNKSPSEWLYCCGRRLEQWVSWAPCRGRCGCSVTLLSYAGQMRVSVVMDRAVEERVEGEELLRLYEDEFRLLESGVPLEYMALV